MVGVEEVSLVEHDHSVWGFEGDGGEHGSFVDTVESLVVSVEFGDQEGHDGVPFDDQGAEVALVLELEVVADGLTEGVLECVGEIGRDAKYALIDVLAE